MLGIRDCSVQRDKQKVIEESGSTMLPKKLLDTVLRSTADIANEVGYIGAGTVEFIYDLKSDAVYFMEMNTRLQVEHPVTEWTSGINIVAEQFRIASGESIADLKVKSNGYSIEARVNAERIVQQADGFWPSARIPVKCRNAFSPKNRAWKSSRPWVRVSLFHPTTTAWSRRLSCMRKTVMPLQIN